MIGGLSATSRMATGHALLYNDPEVDQFERALGLRLVYPRPWAQAAFGRPAEIEGNVKPVRRALNRLENVL